MWLICPHRPALLQAQHSQEADLDRAALRGGGLHDQRGKQCHNHEVFCKNITYLTSDEHKHSPPLLSRLCRPSPHRQSEAAGDEMRAEMRSNFNDPCGQIASFVAGAAEKTQHPRRGTKSSD